MISRIQIIYRVYVMLKGQIPILLSPDDLELVSYSTMSTRAKKSNDLLEDLAGLCTVGLLM